MLDKSNVEVEGKSGVNKHETNVFVSLGFKDFVGEEADAEFYVMTALPDPVCPSPSSLRRFFSSVNKF